MPAHTEDVVATDESPVEATEEEDERKSLIQNEGKTSMSLPPLRHYVPVEVVAFLFICGMVMTLPLTQFYIVDKITREYSGVNKSTTDACSPKAGNSSDAGLQNKIQSKAADYTVFLIFAGTFPGIIQTIVLGSFSDRHGRKLSMLMPICGLLSKEIVYLIVFELDLPLAYLFIGNAIEGFSGGFGTMLTALFVCAADITTAGPKRALRMAIIQAVMTFGSAIGALVAGIWIEEVNFKQPLYFLIALSSACLLFTIFIFPETRRHRPQGSLTFKEHLKSFKTSIQFYTKDTPEKRRWKLIVSLMTFFTSFSVELIKATVLTLYLLATPFCWSKVQITGYTAARAIIDWVCILALTRFLARRLSEVSIAIIGCVSNMLFLVLLGIGQSSLLIIIAVVVGIFSEAPSAMMRSVMSKLVSPDEQGALFASVSTVEMFASSILGVAATLVYKASLSFFPGLIFILLAALIFITAVMLGALSYSMKKEHSQPSQTIIVTAE